MFTSTKLCKYFGDRQLVLLTPPVLSPLVPLNLTLLPYTILHTLSASRSGAYRRWCNEFYTRHEDMVRQCNKPRTRGLIEYTRVGEHGSTAKSTLEYTNRR